MSRESVIAYFQERGTRRMYMPRTGSPMRSSRSIGWVMPGTVSAPEVVQRLA